MCNACPSNLDTESTDEFGDRLLQILNHSGLAMMISIGHRTGLFDVMSGAEPGDSHCIAEAAKLNERYVREWLGAMVTGKIVEFDPQQRTYRLPAEHAALLTRAAEPNNFGSVMQWTSVLGAVEDPIVSCFHHGGGVPYESFARFHQVMAEESAQSVVGGLTEHILPLCEGLTEQLQSGIDVLDVGCGSGRAMNFLARQFPQSRFRGYDVSAEAIDAAKAEASAAQTSNVRFEVMDVSKLDHHQDFDLVTAFDAIHDQADPAGVLSGISRALRPGALFLMQDIAASSDVGKNVDHPLAPFLYTISCMHCMTVSLSAGGAGLGAVWGKELACQMLDDAGFGNVKVTTLEHDIMNYFYLARH